MNKELLKKIGKNILTTTVIVIILLITAIVCYCFWHPGSTMPLPEYSKNAIFIGPGWLNDNDWFVRNQCDKVDFRDAGKISDLFEQLSENNISVVYPCLCSMQENGKITSFDNAQIERFIFLAKKYNIKVVPCVGGVFGNSVRADDKTWRKNFTDSIEWLLIEHPDLAGIHVNVMSTPNGNVDFLQLLDEVMTVMQGKTLSVTACPPPAGMGPDICWDINYCKAVADRCNQLAAMLYGTSIPLEKFYTELVTDWTKQLINAIPQTGCELLLQIPVHNGSGAENISSVFKGISAAPRKNKIDGIVLNCHDAMNYSKWAIWNRFMKDAPKNSSSATPAKF